jgi:hypothetical protein
VPTTRLTVAEWVTIVALVLTGVVWAVRLEGRVSQSDDALAVIRQQQKDDRAEILHELRYIRARLDEAAQR